MTAILTAPLALALAAQSAAPGVLDLASDVTSYCEFVTRSASSAAAPLLAPDLVASAGVAHETQELYGLGPVDALRTRVTVGLRYGLAGLRRGLLLRERGSAECARYRTVSGLRQFLSVDSKAATRQPLRRRLDVLEAALARGREILAQEEAALRSGEITAVERDATALRLDALRALAAEVGRELAALPSPAPLAAPPVRDLLERRAQDEERLERVEGSLRRSLAWDVELRGGYDEVFGVKDRIPVYGLVTVTLNTGSLWQRSADARALVARRAWAMSEVEGIVERAELALRGVEAELERARQRLAETRILAADLKARLDSIASLQGPKVAHYRNHLWFEIVRTDADRAYLDALVGSLGALVAGHAPPADHAEVLTAQRDEGR